MMKKYRMIILMYIVSAPLWAQSGFFDAYDYSRWLGEFSISGVMIGQDGQALLNGNMLDLTAESNQLTREGNWSWAARFEGRKNFWRIAFGGALMKSMQTNINPEQRLVNTLTRADIALGIMPSWDGFYLIAGGRFYDADFARVEGNKAPEKNGSQQWIDPFAGLQLDMRLFNWLAFRLYGDAGVFGVGSKVTWNARASLQWRMGALALIAGYRYERIDYSADADLPFFYKAVNQGPGAGLSYSF